ncbi:MAG: hypothetical protein U9R32_04640 [Bacteroidota bacterium]|nr:hypothetical protein [Bacteroidota bacterium]
MITKYTLPQQTTTPTKRRNHFKNDTGATEEIKFDKIKHVENTQDTESTLYLLQKVVLLIFRWKTVTKISHLIMVKPKNGIHKISRYFNNEYLKLENKTGRIAESFFKFEE